MADMTGGAGDDGKVLATNDDDMIVITKRLATTSTYVMFVRVRLDVARVYYCPHTTTNIM
jgi:hypothetical protein